MVLFAVNTYGNKLTAQIEAKFGKALFTTTDNDCRIDNLTYLNRESEGTGKVYLIKIYDTNKSLSHLIVCNNKNEVIDKNNLFKKNICDFDKLEFNLSYVPQRFKYEKLAELEINNNIITSATLYENTFHSNFDLTTKGIEYTKVFLDVLNKQKHKAGSK